MKFSERYGYTPVRDVIQLESMDEPLRNGLWSILHAYCWDKVKPVGRLYSLIISFEKNTDIFMLCTSLWYNYFKEPIDQLSNNWEEVYDQLRQYFYKCEWYEAYDFVEFVANNYKKNNFFASFSEEANRLLEREMSAYRFVDGIITRITDEQEIAEIEQAAEASAGPVALHLRRSLELLSDRSAPDYRNSVKESISAVESLVSITLNKSGGTLGKLLNQLETEIGLHPALKAAFQKLYGYTSDQDGIRHAMIESGKVDFHDAKFMLVVCSAFINFVEGKAQDGR